MNAYEFSVDEFNKKKKEVFDFFFHKYWMFVYNFSFKIVKNRVVAEDISAETFVKLWKSKEIFLNEQSIKKFICVVTKNACLNIITSMKARNMRYKKYSDTLDISEEIFFRETVKTQVVNEILKEIENLTPGLKNVFKLAYLYQVPDKDISMQLNMEMRSVYNAKHRALVIFREKFKGVNLYLT